MSFIQNSENTIYSVTIRSGISVFTSILAVILLLTGISACSGSETVSETDDPTTDLTELEELYWSRLEDSRTSFTQADVDFMTDMIIHHAQALIMSRLAPENGASQSVQTLAARIINAQEDEIITMQQWLRDRGQPVPMIHIDGPTLMVHMEETEGPPGHRDMHPAETDTDQADHGDMDEPEMEHGDDGFVEMDHQHHHDMSHHDDMPGMLSQEQLEKLANQRGADFDRLFLEYMIEHHEGAVIMVRQLFDAEGAAGNPETFDLSSDIYAEQVTEINRMRLMLERMSNH